METISLIHSILHQAYVAHENLFYVANRPHHVTHANAYQQWNGPISTFGENTGDTSKERENLLNEIAGVFYKAYYMTGNVKGEWFDSYANPSAEEKSDFMLQLSEANQSKDIWDPLWTVISNDNRGTIEVQKNGIKRILMHQEWRPMQALNGQLQKGMQVSVFLKKERKDIQPVFYYVNSEESFSARGSLCRFYFNIKYDHISAFIRTLTQQLNHYQIPFMFKCLNHPSLYIRADSAVLYIEKSMFNITAKILYGIIKHHTDGFNKPTPLFTLFINNGVAFAEDPGNGKSFGMNWCELLAEALIRFYETETKTESKKEAIIKDLIKKRGLVLEHPHMNANSFYPYDFKLFNIHNN